MLFCGLLFAAFLFYEKTTISVNKLKFDVSQVSATDYSVEMDITEEDFKFFWETEY